MTTALFETEVGKINIEFFSDDAPNTVKNFTKLIGEGFYDGLAFTELYLDLWLRVDVQILVMEPLVCLELEALDTILNVRLILINI